VQGYDHLTLQRRWFRIELNWIELQGKAFSWLLLCSLPRFLYGVCIYPWAVNGPMSQLFDVDSFHWFVSPPHQCMPCSDWMRSCWHCPVGPKWLQLMSPLGIASDWMTPEFKTLYFYWAVGSCPTRWLLDAVKGSRTSAVPVLLEVTSPFCWSTCRSGFEESLTALLILFIIFPNGASLYLFAWDAFLISYPFVVF